MEMTEKHSRASIYHSAGLRAWVKKTHNAKLETKLFYKIRIPGIYA